MATNETKALPEPTWKKSEIDLHHEGLIMRIEPYGEAFAASISRPGSDVVLSAIAETPRRAVADLCEEVKASLIDVSCGRLQLILSGGVRSDA